MPQKIAEQKEMPLTGHLAELRQRLIKCLIALGIGFGVSFYFVDGLLALLRRPAPAQLYFLTPTEAFWMSMEISFFVGLFISLPVILYQVWKFISPGLLQQERKYLLPFLLLGTLFFAAGLLFCYFIVLPFALTFLVGFGTEMGLRPLLSIGSYVDFLLKFLLAFGLIFELPLAITLLARMGLMTPEFLSRNRKYAVLVNAVLAAILTPTTDVFNMMLMMIPLLLFYELGVLGAKLFGRRGSAAEVMEGDVGGKALIATLVIFASLCGCDRLPAFGGDAIDQFRYIQARPNYRPPADEAITLYRTNGPGGYAGIQSIAIGQDNTIYVGTYGLGIYKSRNGGKTWQPLTRGLKDYFIHTVYVDSDQRTLYTATIRQGVFISRDAGEHWVPMNHGLPDSEVHVVTVGPQHRLYAGTSAGVFVSRDQGKSWSAINEGTSRVLVRTIVFEGDKAIYIGTAGMGAYKSADRGKSWEQINGGMKEGDDIPEDFIRTMMMDRNGTLYAGTFDGGVFASRDGGHRWKGVNQGLRNTSVRTLLSDSDGALFAGTGGGVYLSQDGGVHWVNITQGQQDVNVQTMTLGRDGVLYVGTAFGLYATKDRGRHWEFLSQNLTTPVVRDILIGSDRNLYAATEGLGVLRSRDAGRSWAFSKEGMDDDFVQALVQDPSGTFYAGTESGVFKSADKGVNWAAMNEGLPMMDGLTVHRMIHHRDGFFIATNAGIFRWESNQNRWMPVESSQKIPKKIHSIVIDNEKTVYLGTEHGILKREEGGSGWVVVEAPLGGSSGGAGEARALLWTEEHGLFAGGPFGLILGKRQTDRSLKWQAKQDGLPPGSIVHVLAQDLQHPLFLYAGTSRGLYWSRNGGDRWEQAQFAIKDEVAPLDVRSLAIRSDGTLYIGTTDAGVLIGINRLSPR
jgi:sec-independent protein translocase protein TatC